jgi:diacylglycerol kinase (ATP)
MKTKPDPQTGPDRIWKAFFYSLKGLGHAFAREAAFRQESILAGVLTLVLIFLPLSLLWKGMLVSAMALVLIAELLNSAIEAVVDLASPEFHTLAGRAKDMGSAAVFISLALTVILWILALISL